MKTATKQDTAKYIISIVTFISILVTAIIFGL